MFDRGLPTFWPVVRRLRSCGAALTAMVGPGKADGWEPLFGAPCLPLAAP